MTLRILIAALSLCLAQSAHSAVINNICVSSTAGLISALTTAKNNGASIDSIYMAAGTYATGADPFGAGLNFASGDSVTIIGGFTDVGGNPCGAQSTDPTLTVIDGQGLRGGMELSHSAGPGSIIVRNLTFVNGHREVVNFGNDRGGGLYITGPSGNTADVLVERCIFRNNYASFIGGGLVASSDGGTVTVRNNLFVGNNAAEGAAMHVFGNNDQSYVANNTVVGNAASLTGISNAAFAPAGNNPLTLTNNIFWNNTSGTQTDLFAPLLVLINNDIHKMTQTPAAGSSGNISVDPRFLGANDFRLTASSPLIDIGSNSPLGGLTAEDLEGLPRIQSGTVDLGAYEFSLLFLNGFEQP